MKRNIIYTHSTAQHGAAHLEKDCKKNGVIYEYSSVAHFNHLLLFQLNSNLIVITPTI